MMYDSYVAASMSVKIDMQDRSVRSVCKTAHDLLDECGIQSFSAAFLSEAAQEPSGSVLYVCNRYICAPDIGVDLFNTSIIRHCL